MTSAARVCFLSYEMVIQISEERETRESRAKCDPEFLMLAEIFWCLFGVYYYYRSAPVRLKRIISMK